MSQLAMDDDKILALLEQNKAMIGDRDPILESVHADLGRPTVDDNWEVRDFMTDSCRQINRLPDQAIRVSYPRLGYSLSMPSAWCLPATATSLDVSKSVDFQLYA